MATAENVAASSGMPRKKVRIGYIDIAKGIAMICIIAGHFGIVSVNRVVYTFHVPLFFLLSGYFLSTRLGLLDFVKTKARQLLVPYYIGCVGIMLFAFFMTLALGGGVGDSVERVVGIIGAALYAAGTAHTEPFAIQQIGLLWFLWALFIGSVIVRFALDTPAPWAIVLVAAFVGWGSSQVIWLPLSIQAGAMASLFLYVGYLARQKELLTHKFHPVAIAACLLLWGLCLWKGYSINIVNGAVVGGVVAVLGSVAASYVIVWLSHLIERAVVPMARFLNYFGQSTLTIMLFHAVADYTFPWYLLYNLLGSFGVIRPICHIIVVGLNVLWPLLGVFVTLRIPAFARLVGARKPQPLPVLER